MEEGYDNEEELYADLQIINPSGFDEPLVEEKIVGILENLGVKVVKEIMLKRVICDGDKNELETVVFEKLGEIEETEEEEDEEKPPEMKGFGGDSLLHNQPSYDEEEGTEEEEKEEVNKRELKLPCKVLITAGHRDVDIDVFNSIHNNSLVYNGRLIVDKSFQTCDPHIFSGGSLSTFSGRYQSLCSGRMLRMDYSNGREIGIRMARSFLEIQDPMIASMEQSSIIDEVLPSFYLPQGLGGLIPGNLIYYHIRNTRQILPKKVCRLTSSFTLLGCNH